MFDKEKLAKWAGNNHQKWIGLAIAMNAREVYDFLKKNSLLGPNWTKGYEQAESSKQKMGEILNTEANKSGNPLRYAIMLVRSLPDPNFNNPVVYKNVQTLLRKNP